MSPFAGVAGYPVTRKQPLWVGGFLLALSDREEERSLLVPAEGGAARSIVTASLGSAHLYSALNHQTFIIRLGYQRNACGAWGIAALDPVTLEQRWEFQPSEVGGVEGLEIGDTLILGIGSWGEQALLLALDLPSGRLLWQHRAAGRRRLLLTNGRVLFEAGEGTLRAVEPRSGAVLWSAPLPTGRLFSAAFGARQAVFFMSNDCDDFKTCLPSLSVWDLELHREARQVPAPAPLYEPPLVRGNDIVLLETSEIRGLRGFRVRVVDASSGRERFISPTQPCGAAEHLLKTHLSATATTIRVCGCDGVLRILSAETGAITGSFSVGRCDGLAASEAGIAHGKLYMNLPRVEDGPRDEEDMTGHLAILQPAAFTAPELTADVSGEVSVDGLKVGKDQWVRIASQLVRADKRGKFKARVLARGVLSADVAVLENAFDDGGGYDFWVVDRPPRNQLQVSLSPPETSP